jgi:hypothetical protein
LNKDLSEIAEDIKQQLLEQIRSYFPIAENEDFGFKTDSFTFESNGFENPLVLVKMNLSKDYFEDFLQIIRHFGYDPKTIHSFTGNYDLNTIRENPYTFVFLQKEGVILAESFVYGNAMFVFGLESLINKNPRWLNYSFQEISKELNALLKSQIKDLEIGIRVIHGSGFFGAVLAAINKCKNIDLGIQPNKHDIEQKRQVLSDEEWLKLFQDYAANSENWNTDDSLIPPSRELEPKLYFKLPRIRQKQKYPYLAELKKLGFNVDEAESLLTAEEWLKLFQDYAADQQNRNTDGSFIQPTKVNQKLCSKLNLLKNGSSFKYTQELIELGFNLEKVREEYLTPEDWLDLFEDYADDPQNRNLDRSLIQPKRSDSIQLYNKLAAIKQRPNFKYEDLLEEMGFIVEVINEKHTDEKWLELFKAYADDAQNRNLDRSLIQPTRSRYRSLNRKLTNIAEKGGFKYNKELLALGFSLEQRLLTPIEWLELFRIYADDPSNKNSNGSLKPPPARSKLSNKLSSIRNRTTKFPFTDELKKMGFNVGNSIDQ